MALSDPTSDSSAKSSSSVKKTPPKSPSMDKRDKQAVTKVIIRRLPPTMSPETFLDQISPVPPHDYFYLSKGDATWGENTFSRAYINFTHLDDIFMFKEKFDNYVFLDDAGHEYPAVVEFSAFQKIPKRRHKVRVDPKMGTVETDPWYIEFVENLNKPPEQQEEKPEFSYQISDTNRNDLSTPLLDFVNNKRAERNRIREERREERKRKEIERKKMRKFDEKSPKKIASSKTDEDRDKDKDDPNKKTDKKSTVFYNKNKPDKKYEDKDKKPQKYPGPKKDYSDRGDHKANNSSNKKRFDNDYSSSSKKETTAKDSGGKKVKKYSEKREEQRKKLEQQSQGEVEKNPDDPQPSTSATETVTKDDAQPSANTSKTSDKSPSKSQRRYDSQQQQKRIRNKDRPTIAIYRPGMLSKTKRKSGDGDPECDNSGEATKEATD